MALCYSITDGIAIGFFTYCLIIICKRRTKEIHPLVWIIAALFFIYMLMRALIVAGLISGILTMPLDLLGQALGIVRIVP